MSLLVICWLNKQGSQKNNSLISLFVGFDLGGNNGKEDSRIYKIADPGRWS